MANLVHVPVKLIMCSSARPYQPQLRLISVLFCNWVIFPCVSVWVPNHCFWRDVPCRHLWQDGSLVGTLAWIASGRFSWMRVLHSTRPTYFQSALSGHGEAHFRDRDACSTSYHAAAKTHGSDAQASVVAWRGTEVPGTERVWRCWVFERCA